MSTTTTSENGNSATNGDGAAPRNRVRSLTGTTRYRRLFALASRSAERKSFTVRRDTEEGTVALKMDGGYPATLDASGVARLATQSGAKASTGS